MTREEIIVAAENDGFFKEEISDMVDFILAMVGRHNEELAKIAETHRGHKKNVEYCWNMIANEIREACPK